MMVQKALSAKSLSDAQGATILTGWIKVLPMFLIVVPGMISRVLFPDTVGCVDPAICQAVCGNPVSCSNTAFPALVLGIMPEGLRGVMLAVMLAALMSDLTSIFNSASTLFTMDLYREFRSSASTKELLIVGRLFLLVLVRILDKPVHLAICAGGRVHHLDPHHSADAGRTAVHLHSGAVSSKDLVTIRHICHFDSPDPRPYQPTSPRQSP